MWRAARAEDDQPTVARMLELYREDPGMVAVTAEQCHRTLTRLRAEPLRGRAVVLELAGQVAGYSLLISFWSNELGGEVCEIDELFVDAAHRGLGHGSALFAELAAGRLWSTRPVALALGVTAQNHRARRLYQRLGFVGGNQSFLRLLTPRGS